MKDGTILAQQVLSAIFRTGQFFGSTYIIDVLRGMKSEKILKNKHHEIKTLEQEKKYKKSIGKVLLDNLYLQNHISINIKKYGAYQITESGLKILKGDLTFQYKSIDVRDIVPEKQYKKTDKIDVEDKELPLLQKLKELRLKLAKEQNVPAYVVFADQTLHHMIEMKPKTFEEMKQIIGMGPSKIEKYGMKFLDKLIRTY